MDYRVYLMDHKLHIRAAEHFTASFDAEAIEIAAALHDAASDVFASCEVWRGNVLLAKLNADTSGPGDGHGNGHGNSQEDGSVDSIIRLLTPVRQANILQLEDRLQRSFACVRESRRLLNTYNEMLDQYSNSPHSQNTEPA